MQASQVHPNSIRAYHGPGTTFAVVTRDKRGVRERVALKADGLPARRLAAGTWRVSRCGGFVEPVVASAPKPAAAQRLEGGVARVADRVAALARDVVALERQLARIGGAR